MKRSLSYLTYGSEVSITWNGLPAATFIHVAFFIHVIGFALHFPLIMGVFAKYVFNLSLDKFFIGARVRSEFPLIGQGNNSGTKAVRLGEAHRLHSNVINLACRHDCKHSNIAC